MFGDDDPEDAWDAHDPAPVLVEVLARQVTSLEGELAPPVDRVRVLARWVGARDALDELRARDADPHRLDGFAARLEAIAGQVEL